MRADEVAVVPGRSPVLWRDGRGSPRDNSVARGAANFVDLVRSNDGTTGLFAASHGGFSGAERDTAQTHKANRPGYIGA